MKKKLCCTLLLTLAIPAFAGKDYFADGGFESGKLDWHYVRIDMMRFDGKNSRAEITDKVQRSGRRSLHVLVTMPGKKANIRYLLNPSELKGAAELVFSGYAKAVKGTPSLSYYMEFFDANGEKQVRSDSTKPAPADGKWQKLSLSIRIPERLRMLALCLDSCGENQTADVYWDDCSATLIGGKEPYDDPKNISALKAEFKLPAAVDNDVYNRPESRSGSFSEQGKFLFYTGVRLDARNPQLKNWSMNKNHIAYRTMPSQTVFENLGINSCQWNVPDAVIRMLTAGEKIPADFRSELEKSGSWALENKGLPVAAAEFTGSVRDFAHDPAKAEKMGQRTSLPHDFLPWCPDCPEGEAYYLARCEMLVRQYFRFGLNIYLYELTRDPVYNCQCPANAGRFAAAMQKEYGTIARANGLWGTDFRDFGDLAKITSFEQYPKLWPDWCSFCAARYRAFLKLLADRIRQIDRRTNIHFGERQTNIFDRTGATADFREHTKDLSVLILSGGLHFGAKTGALSGNAAPIPGGASCEYLFLCDFFQAVSNGKKPIVNLENRCFRTHDGEQVPFRRTDMLTSFWVDFFHGLSGSYAGYYAQRPPQGNQSSPTFELLDPAKCPSENLDVFHGFQQELAPFLQQCAPCPRTKKAAVAVLYSQSTLRMTAIRKDLPFREPLLNWYGTALFSQCPVKIVFEDNLENELDQEVRVLLVPAADYLPEVTVKGIQGFLVRGGKVVADTRAFRFDERGNPRSNPPQTVRADAGKTGDNAKLRTLLSDVPRYVQVCGTDGTPVGDTEAQVIDRAGTWLVLLFAPEQENARRVLVKFPGLPDGKWVLSDAVRKETYDSPEQDMTWSAAQLRKGVEMLLPGQERRILLLTPGLPPGYKLVKYKDEQKRAASLSESAEAPQRSATEFPVPVKK